MYAGIDYGLGQTNIDNETGIRFGVIPANDLGESWYESSEGDYGSPTCPECGRDAMDAHSDDLLQEVIDSSDEEIDKDRAAEIVDEFKRLHHCCGDYACPDCDILFDGEDAFGDEPVGGFNLDDGEYQAHQGHDDCDVFVLKSPYYTKAQFCSPCAPGAAYLRHPCENGPKAYCFAPDWFRPWNDDQVTGEYAGEKTSCPYPVWRVDNDELVFMPKTDEDE